MRKKSIKVLQSFFCVILVLTFLAGGITVFAEGKPIKKTDGNLVVITNKDDFTLGTLNNTVIDETIGDGAIKLTDGAKDGDFVSEIYSISAFEYIVASWNSDTPEGTHVEIQAKVYADADKKWSEWLSWGQWSPYIMRSCCTQSDDLAYIDTDVLTIRGSENQTASKFQLKAILHSDKDGVTPVIRQIAVTYRCDIEGKEIKPIYHGEKIELPEKVLLDTPAYSQMVRDFDIANSICSPTTITTLLNDRGEDLLPEEVALTTYDFKYEGFGNWAFSLASAGARGYESYIQYANMDILYQELAHGYSVGLSVAYSDKPNGSIPYVEGAPLTTNGHLITARGYETIDGVDYIYVSDSAAADDSSSLLKFKAEELNKAWGGIAYIVHEKEQNAGEYGTRRFNGELKLVEGKTDEYELYSDGQKIPFDKDFMSKKMEKLDCGTLAYRFNDAVPAVATEPSITTMANNKFYYDAGFTRDGNIRLNPEYILPDAAVGESKEITVYIITNTGKTYIAPITITKEAAKDASASSEQDVETSAKAKTGMSPWIYISVVAAVIIIAAVITVILKTKKKI